MKKRIQQIRKMKSISFILIAAITGSLALCFAFIPMHKVKSGTSFSGPEKWVAPSEVGKKKNPIAVDDASIAAGKKIYSFNCEICHGKKGRGDGPKVAELDKEPSDFTKEDLQAQTDGELFWKLSEGKKPMPAFKKDLTEEQRWQAVIYLRTFAKKK